jgi:O-6-methylguanine DNA methyltransferase
MISTKKKRGKQAGNTRDPESGNKRQSGVLYQVPTPYGYFKVNFSKYGVAGVTFPDEGPPPFCLPAQSPDEDGSPFGLLTQAIKQPMRTWQRCAERGIINILGGRRPKLPPLDISTGTAFQKDVWRALLAIPPGQTRTYHDIAVALGKPKAARAVGAACGANPIPLFIPCHRVVAGNGRLGGFSGGLKWKQLLLKREGVVELG